MCDQITEDTTAYKSIDGGSDDPCAASHGCKFKKAPNLKRNV